MSENGKFIFLNLDKKSKKHVIDLHKRVFKITKEIGLEKPIGARGPSFSYTPHISITKLSREDATKAINLMRNDFKKSSILVTHYELTKEVLDDKGFSNFPIIMDVKLKS